MDLLLDQDAATRRTTLSRILKLLRRRAGLRSREVAKQMGKAPRTYQRWESGFYGLERDEVYRFAEIVQADPWGIILGVEMGSVDYALRTAGNNGASLLIVALRRFDKASGDDIRRLDSRSLSLVYTRGLSLLRQRAEKHAADLEQWMFDESLGGDVEDEDD
jgi:transcriptional regulator with XRE-family HTH domain